MQKKDSFLDEWPRYPLKELATLGRKSRSSHVLLERDIELPYVTHNNLSIDPYILESENLTKKYVDKKGILYGEGTILISLDRSHRGIGLLKTQALASPGICALRTHSSEITPDFLFHYLRWLRENLNSQEKWKISYLRHLMIPLPAHHIQQYIVKLLEKIDQTRRKHREAIILTDIYTKAVYSSQFNTTRNVKYEQGTLREYISDIQAGGHFNKNDLPSNIPVLKGKPSLSLFKSWQVKQEQGKLYNGLNKHVPVSQRGDILWYRKGNGYSNESFIIVNTWNHPVIYSNEWIRIKPLTHVSSEYLAAFLQREYSKNHLIFRRYNKKKRIDIMSDLPVLIPTQANQEVFASKIKIVSNISKMHLESLRRLDLLYEVLSNRFFYEKNLKIRGD